MIVVLKLWLTFWFLSLSTISVACLGNDFNQKHSDLKASVLLVEFLTAVCAAAIVFHMWK